MDNISTVGKLDETKDRLITVQELGTLLSLTRGAIYMLIQRGQIPHYKLGRRLRFNPLEIKKWIESHKVPLQGALITQYQH